MNQASIWHRDETPGFDKGKGELGFTRWRVLIMERAAELTGQDEDDAVARLNQRGLRQLSLDYEGGRTAEQMAQELCR